MERREFLKGSIRLSIGATSLAVASSATSTVAPPEPGHRILDLELFDAHRQRPVPARLYLPLRASSVRSVPLVVFSHGLGGSRLGYSYLARHWAHAGLASLHPQHVGSDSAVWRGNPLEVLQRLQSAAREAEALARVLDLRFAVNEVLASDQGRLIDASRMAVAGHSYGANTAMLLAGARVNAGSAYAGEIADRRMLAAILISAPPLLGQGPAQQVLGGVNVPTLHITSLEDTINLPGYRSTVEDRIAIYEAMTGSPKTLAVYNTGGHSIFTDRTTRSGPEASARVKAATQELCALFLRHLFRPGGEPRDALRPAFHTAADSVPVEPPNALEGRRETREWFYRHRELLHRFVTPEHQWLPEGKVIDTR